MLYWTGWKYYPQDVFYEESADPSEWVDPDNRDTLQALAPNYRVNSVSLRVEYDAGDYDLGIVEAEEWTVLPNGSHSDPNGWSYACQADITDLVKDALPDDFVGNAKYWVGHADRGPAPPSDDTIQGIWGSSSSNVIIVGNSGTILQYDGASWNPVASGTTRDLKGVWGWNASNIWAVGANSAIRKYTTSWAGQTRSDGRTETLRSSGAVRPRTCGL